VYHEVFRVVVILGPLLFSAAQHRGATYGPVCLYTYMYIHACLCNISLCICVCMNMCICMHVCACVRAYYMYTCTRERESV